MTRKTKPPIAIYSALADTTRCRIVEILLAGPIPVHTLSDGFSISRPAISRHLRVLKTAGLVAEVKKGRENLYALRTSKLGGAMAWIETIASPPAPQNAGSPVTMGPEAAPITEVPAPVRPIVAKATVHAVSINVPVLEAPAKPEKPARATRAEPPINQMGFDF